MNDTRLHIGTVIQEKVKEMGWTDSVFAKKINTSRQNVKSIYTRKSIDSGMLFTISKELGFNLFDCYLENSGQKFFNNSKVQNAKVLIQIEINAEEVVNLNLKERLLTILNK